jgi:hypothetical protein
MAERTPPDSPRTRILQLAEKMLSGDLDLFEGCYEIDRLRYQVEESDDEAFLVIAGVASEVEYMNRVREVVWEACRAIISKLSVTS